MKAFARGTTLHLSGQIDARCTAELRDVLESWLDEQPGDAVLDLSDVEGVDLTALRTIAAFSRAATLDGRWLRMRGCPPLVRRLLHLSHLRGLIHFEDVDAAPTGPALATSFDGDSVRARLAV